MKRPLNVTTGAKVVPVRREHERMTQRMWVKPWDAVPGGQIEIRLVGADWPWHRVNLVAREAEIYIIAP